MAVSIRRGRAMRMRKRRARLARKPSKKFVAKVRKVIYKTSEKKYLPYSNSVAVNTTTQTLCLTNVPQGDTDSTRDGDQIYMRSLRFDMLFTYGDAYNVVRVLCFQWFPFKSGYPATSDVLVDSTNPLISPYNHDQRYNFKVLYDKNFTLNNQNRQQKILRMFITRGFKRKLQYTGGTTDGTNRIFLYLWSDSSTAPDVGLVYSGKLNYADI